MATKRDVSLIFSERIKFLREDAGLTQLQLANKMNEMGYKMSKDIISSFERGIVEPKIGQIDAFCQFFNVTPDLLFGYKQTISYIEDGNENVDFVIHLRKLGISKESVKETKKVVNVIFDLLNKE